MNQPKQRQCLQCGKPLKNMLLGETCPKCLMGLGIGEGSGQSPTTAKPGFANNGLPQVEQLVSEFPNLEIQHLIGLGGMGAVYQARQRNLDRNVALKILSPELSRDPAFAERFLREARTLAKLSHPNIVTVFDFGQSGSYYFLLMELIDGVNLRDTIAANTLDPASALQIVPQICDALQYAHDHQVVHRDIKPENILLDKQGRVKIADFGLAKIMDPTPEQFTLTATRQVMGTRNYMAPEQIETPESVDHRADLYSLGVVFYELLTGELPLGRFALPSEKSRSVNQRLDDVVLRTLEKDPGLRYQQASQIKTACESIDQPFHQPFTEGVEAVGAKVGVDKSPATKYASSQTIGAPIPIQIQDIYASLAIGYGFLRVYETHLELEYEIRDAVVDHRWKSTKVEIPLEDILWVRLYEGLVNTHIEVQANQFDVVKDIPNSKQGAFRLHLKKRERPPARMVIDWLQHQLGTTKTPVATPLPVAPVAPVKSAGRSESGNGALAGILLVVLSIVAAGMVVLLLVAMLFIGVRKSTYHELPHSNDIAVEVPSNRQDKPSPTVVKDKVPEDGR